MRRAKYSCAPTVLTVAMTRRKKVVVPAIRRKAWLRRYTETKAEMSSILKGRNERIRGHFIRIWRRCQRDVALASNCSFVEGGSSALGVLRGGVSLLDNRRYRCVRKDWDIVGVAPPSTFSPLPT